MGYTAAPLEKLIEQFSQFPGIGRKGATRMAYQVLSMSDADAAALAEAIQNAHTRLHRCRVCQNYTEAELCPICSSAKRDRSTICVVETPRDVQAFERTREYHGLYHVLHGLISHGWHRREQLSVKELLAGWQRRGERGHHAMNPPSRARPRPCIWQSSSNLWASRPHVWPTVCLWVAASSTPMRRRFTARSPAATSCKEQIL